MKKLFLILFGVFLLFTSAQPGQCGQKVSLAIMQNGQSMVTESRPFVLEKGKGSVTFSPLAEKLDFDSLMIKSAQPSFSVAAIVYNESLLTQQALLRRHLGEEVQIAIPDGLSAHGRVQKTATILSVAEAPIFLIDGRVYSGPYDYVLFAQVPVPLAPKPFVRVDYSNTGPVHQTLTTSYTVPSLSWGMSYSLTAGKDMKIGTLSGLATIRNNSGTSFPEASVRLIAGSINTVASPLERGFKATALMAMDSAAEMEPSEKLYQYHVYPVRQALDVFDQQTVRVALVSSPRVSIEQRLVGRANALPSGREVFPIREAVDAQLTFRNTSAQGLGVAMPQGTMRVHVRDDEVLQPIGESVFPATPVGATVNIKLGKAFDVVVERTATAYEKIGKNSYKCTWRIEIRNAREKQQEIHLQEVMPGKWKILESNIKYQAVSSNVVQFSIPTQASMSDQPVVLTYTFEAVL